MKKCIHTPLGENEMKQLAQMRGDGVRWEILTWGDREQFSATDGGRINIMLTTGAAIQFLF